MTPPRLSKLELQIMETLWTGGTLSVREIQERFPARGRPAYTTIQTTIGRLETKKAVTKVRKIGNAHIYQAAVSRSAAQRRLVDDLLALFGGRSQPVMAHLIEAGKLSLEDVQEAEKLVRGRCQGQKTVIAALLDHLWQSTLFAGVIALSMPLFRHQAASLRFWLWFTASTKFLFPFALLTLLGRDVLSLLSPAGTMPVFTLIRPAAVHFAVFAAPLAAPAPARIPAADLVLVLWAAGFSAIAFHALSRWLDLRAILQDANPVAMEAPVPVKYNIMAGARAGGPVAADHSVAGGTGAASHTRGNECRPGHEICHLRRRDNLLTALHMLVEGLFWFHPLVWWIGQRLCEERERACDESVLSAGVRPLVYADGILKTCRFYVQSPLACASGVSGADLKLRIGAIIADQPTRALPPTKAMLLALAAGATLMLPFSAGLMGSSPAIKIAHHIVTLLSTRNIETPALVPAAPVPAVRVARPVRHHLAAASRDVSPIAEPAMTVRSPKLEIHIVLDSGMPALAELSDSEDALVCRKPEQLVSSRFAGPQVCLRASQWAKLHADNLDISPDGKRRHPD